jgi:hypothetical protein
LRKEIITRQHSLVLMMSLNKDEKLNLMASAVNLNLPWSQVSYLLLPSPIVTAIIGFW